jgi:hypothetical protein
LVGIGRSGVAGAIGGDSIDVGNISARAVSVLRSSKSAIIHDSEIGRQRVGRLCEPTSGHRPDPPRGPNRRVFELRPENRSGGGAHMKGRRRGRAPFYEVVTRFSWTIC